MASLDYNAGARHNRDGYAGAAALRLRHSDSPELGVGHGPGIRNGTARAACVLGAAPSFEGEGARACRPAAVLAIVIAKDKRQIRLQLRESRTPNTMSFAR